MQLILIGMGSGLPDCLSVRGRDALHRAQLLIGARRLLEQLGESSDAERVNLYKSAEILHLIQTTDKERVCVLYSGDTGFYSGATELQCLLREAGIPYEIIPGLSSVQLLSAALGRPWQDWKLISAHGVDCAPETDCSSEQATFFLTGGTWTPNAICAALTQAGFGIVPVTVGERLGTAQERLCCTTAERAAVQRYDTLSILLVEPLPVAPARSPGFPDGAFCRGEVPMTKQEVRAAALAKLGIHPTDTVWDVGAGTGSVSVELALLANRGAVYAVECNARACELIRENRQKFRAKTLHLVEGYAPQALETLPAPDAVFIGGTKGTMEKTISYVLAQNPAARICVSAIALETLQSAIHAFQRHDLQPEITQLVVSRTKTAGGLHLLMANNPIFLITVNCND